MSYNDTLKSNNTRLKAILDGIEAMPSAQEKTVDITEGGTIEILPDEGYLLSKVTANFNVASSSGGENKLNLLVKRTLTEVTAEDLQGVAFIPTYSFYSQPNLVSVVIPNTVDRIIRYAFQNCSKLNSVIIQGNVLYTIGNYAFGGCASLTNITLPASFTYFEAYAFDGCTNLVSVTILAETPPTLSSGVFNGCKNLSEIFVPVDSVEAYKAATNWSEYADKIFAIEE